jgi:hypothetical protein
MHHSRGLLVAASAAALVAMSAATGAWSEAGHRLVGLVAETHLDETRALAEVRKILKPKETLADAAVWPDTIKDPLYEDDDSAAFKLEHPAHDTYHYANLPFQGDRYAPDVPGARPMDIVETMRASIRVLRGQSTVLTPREALRLLAHLAGDIHQPLHTANAFISASSPPRFIVPAGPTGWRSTLGGNALVYGPQDRFNLHSYWDSHAVNISMRQEDVITYSNRLIRDVPVAPAWRDTGDPDGWPARWVADALVLSKDVHNGIVITEYLGPDDAKRTAHRWRIQQPAAYDDMARSRVPVQLAKGGYRLAAMLRAIWPERR